MATATRIVATEVEGSEAQATLRQILDAMRTSSLAELHRRLDGLTEASVSSPSASSSASRSMDADDNETAEPLDRSLAQRAAAAKATADGLSKEVAAARAMVCLFQMPGFFVLWNNISMDGMYSMN